MTSERLVAVTPTEAVSPNSEREPVQRAFAQLSRDTRDARDAREAIKPHYRDLLRLAKKIPAWCKAKDDLLGLVEGRDRG